MVQIIGLGGKIPGEEVGLAGSDMRYTGSALGRTEMSGSGVPWDLVVEMHENSTGTPIRGDEIVGE